MPIKAFSFDSGLAFWYKTRLLAGTPFEQGCNFLETFCQKEFSLDNNRI